MFLRNEANGFSGCGDAQGVEQQGITANETGKIALASFGFVLGVLRDMRASAR